jgi:hypothetical protein
MRTKSTNFDPNDHVDITTTQMATFYKAVGGDYDALFLETPPSEVSFIYQSLGCLHSVQPDPGNDGLTAPSIPSLKPKGFVTWETVQLLLAPEEHVPFLQRTLKDFDIIDPKTGSPFPKILPADCFPTQPDEEMVKWYQNASQRLQKEAEEARVTINKPRPRAKEDSSDSENGRPGAARYFSNPLYRDQAGRPTIVREYSRPILRSPREYLQDRGRAVVTSVRNLWNPPTLRPPTLRPSTHHARRRSWHAEDIDDDYSSPRSPRYGPQRRRSREPHARSPTPDSSTDIDPIRRRPRSPRRHHSSSRHHTSPRRHLSPRVVGSPHGSARLSRSNSPNVHRHRTYETSPRTEDGHERGYFESYKDESSPLRRHSSANPAPTDSPRAGFIPSTAAPFVARVAQLQGNGSSASGGGGGGGGSGSNLSSRTYDINRTPSARQQHGRRESGRRGSYSSRAGAAGGEAGSGATRRGASPRFVAGDRSRDASGSRDSVGEFRDRARRSQSSDSRHLGRNGRLEGDARYESERDRLRERDRERDRDRDRDRHSERDRDRDRDRRRGGDGRYGDRDSVLTGVDGRRYPDRSWA